MELENTFTVPSSIEHTWGLLMDVPRIVPCMPGTELLSVDGEDAWTALMRVQMGPMKMAFDVQLRRDQIDADGRSVVLRAHATEQRGRGNAEASIRSQLTADGTGTDVRVTTDVVLSGRVAQFAGGVVEQVAGDMTNQFAVCLQALATGTTTPVADAGSARDSAVARPLAAPAPPTPPTPHTPAAPAKVAVGSALLRAIAAAFRRIFARG